MLLFLFQIGIIYTELSIPENRANHYNKFTEQYASAKIEVKDPPVNKGKYNRFFAEVKLLSNEYDTISTSGKILVYLKHGDMPKIGPGSNIEIPVNFSEPSGARNPMGFNYKDYLFKQGVYHIVYVNSDDVKILEGNSASGFKQLLSNLNEGISNSIKRNIKDSTSVSIALALLLGDKHLLSDETTQVFSATGTMHILAVSGLHVGIIYLIFYNILSIIPYLKGRNTLRIGCLLLIIWLYAFLTGLSPSIFRAAIMFSFITMGKPSGQTTNTINILASAAFTLLIINPLMILQLGFQLSFLAVLSIVTFQPFIEKLWIPRNRIVAYFWSIISVSIAAQIGTAPIAMLTFHQFPIYFILSNIIAIPLSFTIMLSGVLFILFNWIALFSNPLALIFSGQIKALYWGLETLESLPFSLHSGIYLSTGFILLCYLTLILLYKLIVSRDAISLNLMLLALSTTSITFAFQKLNKSTENKIIFHATDASVISVIQGERTYLISSAPVDSMKGYAFDVLPFLESRNSNLLEEYPFQELTDNKANPCIEINNKHILILEDFDKELPVCNTEIVYLRSNYIDTLMALERYSGSLWILDNSIGYKSINFIEPFLCSHQIGYHTLKREGALELISSRVL